MSVYNSQALEPNNVTFIATDLCPSPATRIIRPTSLQRVPLILPISQLPSLRMSYGYHHCNFVLKTSTKESHDNDEKKLLILTISICWMRRKCVMNMSQHKCFSSTNSPKTHASTPLIHWAIPWAFKLPSANGAFPELPSDLWAPQR